MLHLLLLLLQVEAGQRLQLSTQHSGLVGKRCHCRRGQLLLQLLLKLKLPLDFLKPLAK